MKIAVRNIFLLSLLLLSVSQVCFGEATEEAKTNVTENAYSEDTPDATNSTAPAPVVENAPEEGPIVKEPVQAQNSTEEEAPVKNENAYSEETTVNSTTTTNSTVSPPATEEPVKNETIADSPEKTLPKESPKKEEEVKSDKPKPNSSPKSSSSSKSKSKRESPKLIPESNFDQYYLPKDDPDSPQDRINPRNKKAEGTVQFEMNFLDAPLIDITWCGPKKNVIFMLTEASTLYKSVDDGFTGHALTDHLKKLGRAELAGQNVQVGQVSRILQSPVDKSLLLIVGTEGVSWITEDCGGSFKAMDQGRPVDQFQFHPIMRNWLLASAWTKCEDFDDEDDCKIYKELFVTKDLGENWQFVQNYVFDFTWATVDLTSFTRVPKERIIISHDLNGKKDQIPVGRKRNVQISYSDDFFSERLTILAKKANKFLLTKHYLFVIQVVDESEGEVELLVSDSRVKDYDLKPAQIPTKKLLNHGYTILDASEDAVFLHTDHSNGKAPFGNIYVSDSTGVRYSLALKNNIRDFSGQCDFERVQGIEGIYLSNVYDADAVQRFKEAEVNDWNDIPTQIAGSKKVSTDTAASKKAASRKTLDDFKKTMISFDKGGIWQSLTPPEKGVRGKRISCASEDECSLHLHSISSDRFGPFYTTENSLGIILGTGNIGAHLSNRPDEINTYLSRDGGVNWFEIAKGSHIYEVGDHGGLIVMAPNQNATKRIYYSWNEGISWEAVKISNVHIQVTNIIIEPSNTGEKFIVYGKEYNGDKGFVAAVDFSTLHQRVCELPEKPNTPESDYETWSPNGKISPYCLLGRQVTYTRRKRDAQCFNKEDHDLWISRKRCECTEEDWECDFGYARNGAGPCLPVGQKALDLAVSPPGHCDSYFYVSQGYRKVAGDQCISGVTHDPIRVPCPGTGTLSSRNLSALLILTGILLLFVWLNNTENSAKVKGVLGSFKEKVQKLVQRDSKRKGYSNKIPSSHEDDDDESGFSNVIFDDTEDGEGQIEMQPDNVVEENKGKKMTERNAIEGARKRVPLLNRPGEKKVLDF